MILLGFNIVSPSIDEETTLHIFLEIHSSLSRILEESYFWLFLERQQEQPPLLKAFPDYIQSWHPCPLLGSKSCLPPICLSRAFRRSSYRLFGCQGGDIEWAILTFAARLLRRDVGQLGCNGQILTNIVSPSVCRGRPLSGSANGS